jgi:hypothetical protein
MSSGTREVREIFPNKACRQNNRLNAITTPTDQTRQSQDRQSMTLLLTVARCRTAIFGPVFISTVLTGFRAPLNLIGGGTLFAGPVPTHRVKG